MKRMSLALVLATAVVGLALAPLASASPVPSLGTLELNAGYCKSSTDATSTMDINSVKDAMGGGLSFGAAYWRGTSPLTSFGIEAGYDNLGTAKYDNGSTNTNEVRSNILRVNPALRLNFGAPVGPSFFAQGGVGLYNVKMKIDDSVLGKGDASQSKIGFNFGAGVGFPVGPKAKMSLTGAYHVVPAPEENNVKLMKNSNYLQFRAGIGFGL